MANLVFRNKVNRHGSRKKRFALEPAVCCHAFEQGRAWAQNRRPLLVGKDRALSRYPATIGWLVLAAVAAMLAGCRRAANPREVWAEVNGRPIYRDDVERYYRGRMAAAGSAAAEQVLTFKLNILDQLIDKRLLLEQAARSGIVVSGAQVDTKIRELGSPYSGAAFQRNLQKQGLTPASLREQVRQDLLVESLLNAVVTSRISVSSREIQEYYDRNRASFGPPEAEYHLAQILVVPGRNPCFTSLKNTRIMTAAEARGEIGRVYRKLQSGADFATLAERYSEDSRTAAGGGDMGFISASALASEPAAARAVSSLAVGKFSPVIHDRDGYHILKLLGFEKGGERKLSDPQVQAAIRQSLMSEKEQLLKAAYIEDLRDHAKIANYLAADIVRAAGVPPGFGEGGSHSPRKQAVPPSR